MIEKRFTDVDGDAVRFELGCAPHPDDHDTTVFVVTEGDCGAYLSSDNLRELRDAIDEHLGDRPKPVTVVPPVGTRVEWRDPIGRSMRERIDAELRRAATRSLWTLPPAPSRTRAEEIVYGIAEAHLAALKKEAEK